MLGLRCMDCAWFDPYDENKGVCLCAIAGVDEMSAFADSCPSFEQKGCVDSLTEEAIAGARRRKLADGISKWNNPFADG